MLGRETDAAAERLAIARRQPIEPLVVALGAGHHDAIRRHPVPLDRFTPLRLVPDEHPIGHDSQERLARQVIPAEHTDAGSTAERTSGAQMIELRRAPDADRRKKYGV